MDATPFIDNEGLLIRIDLEIDRDGLEQDPCLVGAVGGPVDRKYRSTGWQTCGWARGGGGGGGHIELRAKPMRPRECHTHIGVLGLKLSRYQMLQM